MVPVELLIAFLGGVCPALIWLFFWLMEDKCQPEPKRYIFFAFAAGMFSIIPALLLQYGAQWYLDPQSHGFGGAPSLGLIAAWALIEELVIFGAAYFAALQFYVYDEPIDAVVYLVTAALGFSAVENALFLWKPIIEHDLFKSIALGESRFMGAMLVHALASSTIGISLAISFGKPSQLRKLYALCGIILAATLHTLFNYFILTTSGGGAERAQATFWIFVCVWFGIIATLLIIERLKKPNDYC